MKKVVLIILLMLMLSCKFNNDADVSIDGSSTVGPITNAVVEEFALENKGVDIAVGVSGTGGGFKKFVAGEIDIANASRPIKDSERKKAEENGIEFLELNVAIDGITVVLNSKNDWISQMTDEELKKLWEHDSKIKKWNDINPNYPNIDIKLYGPDQDSGTYDYFIEEILGHDNKIRADYSPASDDNQLVHGVEGDRGAIGYFGYAYYLAQKDKLKAMDINGVSPTDENIMEGKYKPLSRPLYIYVNKKSLIEKPLVKSFVLFYFQKANQLVKEEGYVPLKNYEEIEKLINSIK
ncbi:MAG: PstS family phosphate ABC transporter substrate-binding protein [Leptotrichiaceae bacterium]|nr:PstS family phosphate ABC transporter substrate-binding protein [Leptotrichiaceae bacterium]